MKKSLWLLTVLAAVAVGSISAYAGDGKDEKGAAVQAATCPKCGELKGGDKCCKPDMVKCDKCGLDKGSPGCKAKCCAVCTHCGEIKGGDKCCKPDAVKCEKCGLNKGSPGCKAKCGT